MSDYKMITRRYFLHLLAGSSGAFLFGCRDRGGQSEIAVVPSPTVPSAEPYPVSELTPTLRPTTVATPTLPPTALPPTATLQPLPPTAIATATPLPPTPTLPPTATPLPTVTLPPTATPIPTVIVPTVTPFVPQSENVFMPLVKLDEDENESGYPVPAAPTAVLTPTPVPPTPTPTPRPCLTPRAAAPEVAPPFVGLHASADPQISDWERCTFAELRPSLVKVMTFHPPDDIGRLAGSQPTARWIIRTFLEFGGRTVSAEQFVEWTLPDAQRTVNVLSGRDLTIELHNEPNLVPEGLTASWADGSAFATWFLTVLAQYRAAIPGIRMIYPGLSPGGDIAGVRQDSTRFLEESRAAVEAADGLGLHLYWSADYSMAQALGVLDDVIGRFPNKPIWITEASYNRGGIDDAERADQYLSFINALRSRPIVQGVTFFVASASDPQFADETWVGRGLAQLIGERSP